MPCAALGRKSFHRHPAMQWFSMLSREWGVVGAARDWSLFRRGFTSESAVQIKVLQERTEAPVGDVKAALLQCGWDTGPLREFVYNSFSEFSWGFHLNSY